MRKTLWLVAAAVLAAAAAGAASRGVVCELFTDAL